jgi:hypothetical protein
MLMMASTTIGHDTCARDIYHMAMGGGELPTIYNLHVLTTYLSIYLYFSLYMSICVCMDTLTRARRVPH